MRSIRQSVVVGLIAALSTPALVLGRVPTERELAVAIARMKMQQRGWTPALTKRTRLALPDAGVTRTSGTTIQDDGITMTFEGWDDGVSATWEGLVTIQGQYGDAIVHFQQVDFSDPANPQLIIDDQIYANPGSSPAEGSGGGDTQWLQPIQNHQCPQPCNSTGQARKVVRLNPNFKTFYKCSAEGCGISAAWSIFSWLVIPEVAFATMFWNGCGITMLTCAYNNLWRYE